MASWNYPELTHDDLLKNKSSLQLPLDKLQQLIKYLSDGLMEPSYRRELKTFFTLTDFHDFKQGIMQPHVMRAITKEATGIILEHPAQLDINIAEVSENTLQKLHSHEHAIATAIVLGQEHGYDNPVGGKIYDSTNWVIPKVGQSFVFDEGAPHGLKRTPEGNLTFLTAQSLSVNPERFGLPVDYQEVTRKWADDMHADVNATGRGIQPEKS